MAGRPEVRPAHGSPPALTWQRKTRPRLEAVNQARNAIAHANEDELDPSCQSRVPQALGTIKLWHNGIDRLAACTSSAGFCLLGQLA